MCANSDRSQDYYATIYSAEIVNTLTNLLFMYLAVKGINNCLKNGHDRIFLVTFFGYLLVGTGSFLFHTTLKCTFSTTIYELNPFLNHMLRDCRPDAACRRIIHDIHHLPHVLCHILLLEIKTILCTSGHLPGVIGAIYYLVLSLLTRSCLPSKHVRTLDSNCVVPKHVGYGSKHKTFFPCKGERSHGTSSKRSYQKREGQARPEGPEHCN